MKQREVRETKKKGKIKKEDQKKEDQKPNQAGPLHVKEDTNKIITTGEGQNDHNKINIAKANTTRKPW